MDSGEKGRDLRFLMNLHNNEAGRTVRPVVRWSQRQGRGWSAVKVQDEARGTLRGLPEGVGVSQGRRRRGGG